MIWGAQASSPKVRALPYSPSISPSLIYFLSFHKKISRREIYSVSYSSIKVSFFTVAMNDDLEEIRRQSRLGLSYTPYLKVKLDADPVRAQTMLQIIEEESRARVGSS